MGKEEVVRVAQEAFRRPAKTPMSQLQERLGAWQREQFKSADRKDLALGIMEELGELARAILKNSQGIRGYDDPKKYLSEAGDAIGDLVIYAINEATKLELDFETLLVLTAAEVMGRDWLKFPLNADLFAATERGYAAADRGDVIPLEGVLENFSSISGRSVAEAESALQLATDRILELEAHVVTLEGRLAEESLGNG